MNSILVVNILLSLGLVQIATAALPSDINTELTNVQNDILLELDAADTLLDAQVTQTVLVLNVINRAVPPELKDSQLKPITFPIYQQFLTFVRNTVNGTTGPAIDKLEDSQDRLSELLRQRSVDEGAISTFNDAIDRLLDSIPGAIGKIIGGNQAQFNGLLVKINGIITRVHREYQAQQDLAKYRAGIDYALITGEKGNWRLIRSLEYSLEGYYDSVFDKIRRIIQAVLAAQQ